VEAQDSTEYSPAVAMSPSGRFVATVGDAHDHWAVWDTATGALFKTGRWHDGTGACLCRVLRNSRIIVSAECEIIAHTGGARAVEFSPCGQWLATGGNDGAIILSDTQTWTAEHRLRMQATRHAVKSLSFSSDGALLASGTSAMCIGIWDLATAALLRVIQGWGVEPWGCIVQFSPTAPRLLAAMGADQIHLWDADLGTRQGDFDGALWVKFSPDGRSIATTMATAGNDTVALFDVERIPLPEHTADFEGILNMMPAHESLVHTGAFSPDGSKLMTADIDGTFKVMDSSTGALLHTLHPYDVADVAWGRDWVRDTQRAAAFAMGLLPRLGAESWVQALDPGVLRMILDRV
jgi:WD40 repeat protein